MWKIGADTQGADVPAVTGVDATIPKKVRSVISGMVPADSKGIGRPSVESRDAVIIANTMDGSGVLPSSYLKAMLDTNDVMNSRVSSVPSIDGFVKSRSGRSGSGFMVRESVLMLRMACFTVTLTLSSLGG